jgi:hypothetical protein
MIIPIHGRLPDLENVDERFPERERVTTLARLAYENEVEEMIRQEKSRLGDKYVKHEHLHDGSGSPRSVHTIVVHYKTMERYVDIKNVADLVVAVRDTGLFFGFDGNELALMEMD